MHCITDIFGGVSIFFSSVLSAVTYLNLLILFTFTKAFFNLFKCMHLSCQIITINQYIIISPLMSKSTDSFKTWNHSVKKQLLGECADLCLELFLLVK